MLLGMAAAVLAASLSSLAGVYFEAIVKRSETAAPSLWVRNVQLCLFTLPIAAVTVGAQWGAVRAQGLVLDTPTVLLVTLNAGGGLLVAAVIKYGDNILKNFTTACSVILGTMISVGLFGFELTPIFGTGALLVVGATYVYATAPEPQEVVYALAAQQPRHEEGEERMTLCESAMEDALEDDKDSPHGR